MKRTKVVAVVKVYFLVAVVAVVKVYFLVVGVWLSSVGAKARGRIPCHDVYDFESGLRLAALDVVEVVDDDVALSRWRVVVTIVCRCHDDDLLSAAGFVASTSFPCSCFVCSLCAKS